MAEFLPFDELASWFPAPIGSQSGVGSKDGEEGKGGQAKGKGKGKLQQQQGGGKKGKGKNKGGGGGSGGESKQDRGAGASKSKSAGGASDVPPPTPSGPPTIRDYFLDTYNFQGQGSVVRVDLDVPVKPGAEETWSAVVLDRTVFHPQGGGQPADQGVITGPGGASFQVEMVKNVGTEVVHYGRFAEGSAALAAGTAVALSVDEARRRLHARVHSAGHLIDQAMHRVGIDYPAGKGYHFADGPYVEYVGKIDKAEFEAIVAKLQAAMDSLIAENIPTEVKMVLPSEAAGFCLDAESNAATFAKLPPEDPVRMVLVGGDKGCPCGGTHVKATSELGKVVIKGLRVKKGQTRVTYNVA